jgi:hypothetical protein
MQKNLSGFHFGLVIALGAVWGFSEAALGLGLQKCATLMSGSIMTGVALFFIASGWVLSGRVLGVAVLIITASLIKLFDALLLSLPLRHGAVANPIFAFFMEGLAFLAVVSLIRKSQKKKMSGQAFLGVAAALGAVCAFPLVKFATGVPACVFPGTRIPLSLYYGPLAVAVSALTVPLGFWAGNRLREPVNRWETAGQHKALKYIVSPLTIILCLVLITLIRRG